MRDFLTENILTENSKKIKEGFGEEWEPDSESSMGDWDYSDNEIPSELQPDFETLGVTGVKKEGDKFNFFILETKDFQVFKIMTQIKSCFFNKSRVFFFLRYVL